MPRLLLVDDNPSIHKIAESLLAPTGIQLVCAESAQEALNLVAQGEHFDVALLDIMMTGMDGWQLLDLLRVHPSTARIPIAMMAGVLDTVDPLRLQQAFIQGFLKKPVELRDLGERIHKLLETRVEPPPAPAPEFSPFSTLPAVKLSDLPEFRAPSGALSPLPPPAETGLDLPDDAALLRDLDEVEADLLVLTEADLWVDLPPPPGTGTEDLSLFAEIQPEESLDLEEFDLESLKGLALEPAPPAAPALSALEPTLPAFEPVPAPEALPEPAPVLGAFPEEFLPPEPETQELPDLGPEVEPTFDPEALAGLDALSGEAFEPRSPLDFSPGAFAADPDFLAGLGETSITSDVSVVDWADESEELLGTLTPSQPLPPLEPEDEDQLDLGEPEPQPSLPPALGFPLAEPDEEPFVPGELPGLVPVTALAVAPAMSVAAVAVPQVSAPIPAPVLAGAGLTAEEVMKAIAADPALLDQLAKALVTKLSDQVLREIAWEVMPEMAERLNRH